MKRIEYLSWHLSIFLALIAVNSSVAAQDKQGYWWYDKKQEQTVEELRKPEIPPVAVLMKMKPSALSKLVEDQKEYALTVLNKEATTDYWRLVDISRRRSLAFTALTSQAMLDVPALNVRGAYPLNGPGRTEFLQAKQRERDQRLMLERHDFALTMFSKEGCSFCVSQWSILKAFADKYHWQLVRMDVDERPDLAARFNITATPVTVMIQRGTKEAIPVAVGSEALSNIVDNTYRAVRGEITPQQGFNTQSDDGQFFDPLSPPEKKE
jgi:conjugal transfer pilus assembly protein TraF